MDLSKYLRIATGLTRSVGWMDAPWSRHIDWQDRPEPLSTKMSIGAVAGVGLGAVGVAAAEINALRGGPGGQVSVARDAAALAMCANDFLRVDGKRPVSWPELTRFYLAADGWVFLHGGFPPQAKRLVAALDAPADRDGLAARLAGMTAQDIEDVCVAANTCGRRVRTFQEWNDHPASKAIAAQPVISLEPLGQGPARPWTSAERPLSGIRVLDLSRVLAGPTIGRTLAEHGADVLRIASPHLPSIEPLVIDTGYGKRSAYVDLETDAGRAELTALVREADVLIDGYRPGALAAKGFGVNDLDRMHPGIVYLTLSAFGETGPWGGTRGYDSLVQATVGLAKGDPPKRLPCQPLDYLVGYLGAFAIMRALMVRAETGAGARIELSLAGMAHWLRRIAAEVGPVATPPEKNPVTEDVPEQICEIDTVFGRISALRPALDVPWRLRQWEAPVPLGTHDPVWL
ncbi:MAG: CoA transferase [Pseudomonadota bacterium]